MIYGLRSIDPSQNLYSGNQVDPSFEKYYFPSIIWDFYHEQSQHFQQEAQTNQNQSDK